MCFSYLQNPVHWSVFVSSSSVKLVIVAFHVVFCRGQLERQNCSPPFKNGREESPVVCGNGLG